MNAILRVRKEDIDTIEKRGKYSASIIGCGRKGILYALSFAEAGFRVICTDADQHLVKNIAKGKIPFFDKTKHSNHRAFHFEINIGLTPVLSFTTR